MAAKIRYVRPVHRLVSLRERLRRFLHPGHSSWTERLLLLAFLSTAVLLTWFGGRFPPLWQGLAWAAWFLGLGVVSTFGWLPLLGPVFAFDLVRIARRSRPTLLRIIYATALLLLLLALYSVLPATDSRSSTSNLFVSRFAENFCYTYLAIQFVMAAILTPASLGGIIAEEKERRTMEFLLATQLRDREILLGKLASRLLDLTLLLLTGLPILSLTQLWGGIDFGVLLWFFAATGATILSLAGFSTLASVYCRKARDAIVLTYLTGAGYLALTGLLWNLLRFKALGTLVLLPGPRPFLFKDLIENLTAGNPILATLHIRKDILGSTTLPAALQAHLGPYLWTHLLIAGVCLLWALLRLRALALPEPTVRPPWRRGRLLPHLRPRVGGNPILWKELWAEPGLMVNAFGKTLMGLIALVSLLPALWIVGTSGLRWWEGGRFNEGLGLFINLWVQVVGTLVASLMLLGVAVRAANSISGERDRQTLDILLTTPLQSTNLLLAKWLGSLWSVRWAGLLAGRGLGHRPADRRSVPGNDALAPAGLDRLCRLPGRTRPVVLSGLPFLAAGHSLDPGDGRRPGRGTLVPVAGGVSTAGFRRQPGRAESGQFPDVRIDAAAGPGLAVLPGPEHRPASAHGRTLVEADQRLRPFARAGLRCHHPGPGLLGAGRAAAVVAAVAAVPSYHPTRSRGPACRFFDSQGPGRGRANPETSGPPALAPGTPGGDRPGPGRPGRVLLPGYLLVYRSSKSFCRDRGPRPRLALARPRGQPAGSGPCGQCRPAGTDDHRDVSPEEQDKVGVPPEEPLLAWLAASSAVGDLGKGVPHQLFSDKGRNPPRCRSPGRHAGGAL